MITAADLRKIPLQHGSFFLRRDWAGIRKDGLKASGDEKGSTPLSGIEFLEDTSMCSAAVRCSTRLLLGEQGDCMLQQFWNKRAPVASWMILGSLCKCFTR